jgi:DNA-binding SARP family transcriptional activator
MGNFSMTKVLKLSLLGPFQIEIDEQPLLTLVSGKAQALLCYLAVNGRSHSRQILAGLLWGDLPEADARRNLRGVLMKLRHDLTPFLDITHQTIGINQHAHYQVDVNRFRTLVEEGGINNLQAAIALYQGEFLDEFYVRDAPDFEAWVGRQRTQLYQFATKAYDTLILHYQKNQAYTPAIELAQRLLTLDMTREASHRHLMLTLALNGERNRALDQLTACRQILQDELGVEISEETAVLADQIRTGTLTFESKKKIGSVTPSPATSPTTLLPPPSPFIAGPPITYPARFFGRSSLIKRLFNLFRQRPLQNAAIIGSRRSGKTSLLHYLKTIATANPDQLRPSQQTEWLSNPEVYRWILVDFQDPRLGSCDGLLTYLLTEMGFEPRNSCDIDEFLDIVAFNLNNPTIILFDEIGVALTRYPELDDTFWESLRSLATNQTEGNLGFILTSHEPPDQLAQHSGYGSPFFNIFAYTAQLGPFTEVEAAELMASSPIPFPHTDVAWMLQESGRWPFLLQILCRERLISLEDGDVDTAWREDALVQLVPFLSQKDGS